MRGSFLFLGSGASLGVPVIGCSCSICQSHSPYNHRLRPSGLITIDNKTFLIDAGPDLRTQALKYHLKHLDGLLLTHTHFDHVAGLDDLRPYSFFEKKALPCLLSKESFDQLKICYHYLMHPLEGEITSTKHFQFHLFQVLKNPFICLLMMP